MNSKEIKSVLMVCTGNICRSPTAEGVLRARAEKAGLNLEIDSCGTQDYHVGEAPDRRSQQHALKRGYDLSRQRARKFAAIDFNRFDLILAMDRSHLAALRAECPLPQRHKLQLFLDFGSLDKGGEVPDPYYGGDAGFERVLDLIEDAADGLISQLRST
ncbi:low molecular weight protein-tyrosine-phosphatase [Chitinimonas sp.]|uniref:low molecular weight protein-tyrosine-phosphatase n=1 Tax=Chitinimonas sp. TaxID=1934313 RepID=UPI002F95FF2F